MKEIKMKTPFSIKLIYWIVNGVFWILILGTIILAGDQVLYWFGVNENPHFTFSMPLRRDLLPISEVNVNGVLTQFKVVKIIGGFNVWDLDTTFAIVNTVTFYLNALLFIYALRVILKMLKNVKINIVFTLENVFLLKRSAYVFFTLWVIKDVFMLNYVKFLYTNFAPHKNLFFESWFSNYLLLGSLTLAVAYIFEHGVKLQNYKNLTI